MPGCPHLYKKKLVPKQTSCSLFVERDASKRARRTSDASATRTGRRDADGGIARKELFTTRFKRRRELDPGAFARRGVGKGVT